MSKINTMTRKQFNEVPWRKSWQKEVICDTLVILPGYSREMHDSGYRLMDFIAVKDDKPICRLSGCSDVLHIDGIGGYGKWKPEGGIPKMVVPSGWSIDCLPKSGLLRLFCYGNILCTSALSSFEIYKIEKKETNR